MRVMDRDVTLPVEVRDASAATVIWDVDAADLASLLPTDEVEVVEPTPGRAKFAFTCAAGRQVWGFPKTVERIAFDIADDHATVTLVSDGDDPMPATSMASYTVKDGRIHATSDEALPVR